MAPVRLLCKSLLRSAVKTVEHPSAPELTANQDEEEEEDSPEMESEEAEDSDESVKRRRRRNKPETNDLNENSIDLRDIFTESTSWTSILV